MLAYNRNKMCRCMLVSCKLVCMQANVEAVYQDNTSKQLKVGDEINISTALAGSLCGHGASEGTQYILFIRETGEEDSLVLPPLLCYLLVLFYGACHREIMSHHTQYVPTWRVASRWPLLFV